jgi:small conductance mechanosensitive channel
MDPTAAAPPPPPSLDLYIEQVTLFGDKFGPLLVKAVVLLVIVLLITKFLGRFFTIILTKLGMPERKALMAVTVMHMLVLLVAALVVLNLLGFPGILLFRIIIVIVMVGLAAFIIAKPYIPQLPFKTGDTIKAGVTIGKVEKITFMHTLIRAFDAKMVFIPNHKILNDQVVNFAINPNRRVDVDFFIPYDQDVAKVKKAVGEVLASDENILKKPAAKVVISKFTPDYRHMQARFWVPRTKAIVVRWAVNEEIDAKFVQEGIKMASPRMEITQKQEPVDSEPAEDA